VRIFLFFLPLLFLSFVSNAQRDTSYVGRFDRKMAISTYIVKDFAFLVQEFEPDRDIAYIPNTPASIGLGFSWKNAAFSLSYGYGFDFLRDKKLGRTKSVDFQFHNYGRMFAFDIFIQNYKGFYVEEDDKTIRVCPDVKMYNYGLFSQYVFNHKKFSYKAAFDRSEKQLRSAGSLLVGAGIYFTSIESDSSFIVQEKNFVRSFQFGVSAGYAYTWVIRTNWFINLSTTVGIHFGSEKLNRFGKQKPEISPTVFPRISTGYAKHSWSLDLSYLANILFPSFSENKAIGILSGSGRITFTKRFNSIFQRDKRR
jgi:hypothetical protein